MTLREIIFAARGKLKDQGMKRWRDPELVIAANEAKDDLVATLRQSKKDYFQTTVSVTIPISATPNMSTFALPADFANLKDIKVTTPDYEWIDFIHLDHADPRFNEWLRFGASFASGEGFFYYDIIGREMVVLAPGSDLALDATLYYSRTCPDMALPTDTPTGIPEELHDYLVTYVVAECLRETGDAQLQGYLDKLEKTREDILQILSDQQVREPQFARGFMEGEW
jgi:hypothetical protein